jgi:hypothetical protein
MSISASFDKLAPGSWIACWGSWEICVRIVDRSWHVSVWSPARRAAHAQVAERGALLTSEGAVAWACAELRRRGAIAFVDGRRQSLEKFLAFVPAEDAVPPNTRSYDPSVAAPMMSDP